MSQPASSPYASDEPEPSGSEADVIEQSLDGNEDDEVSRTIDDPEVPVADALEQAQPVTGADEGRPDDG